jgi:hypothetical protein
METNKIVLGQKYFPTNGGMRMMKKKRVRWLSAFVVATALSMMIPLSYAADDPALAGRDL